MSLNLSRTMGVVSTVDLSIIIISWNTHDLLAQCLESVFCNIRTIPDVKVETFVVDNASVDGTVEMTLERFPWVQLIENQTNVGFAQANNQALALSKGRYVLLLNPDTDVKPEALQALLGFMDTQSGAGAAGSWLLNGDGTLQTSCYPAPTLSRELWRLFHLDALYPYGYYRMDKWNRETPREVDVLQGACLILRKDILDKIGLLDNTYFMYSEEVDLCYRLQKAGWQLYWVPASQVVHYGGQSTQQVAREMFLQLYRGKLLYFRKHHGQFAGRIYKGILLLASLTRLLLVPLAWLQRPSQREKSMLLADHYRHLLAVLPDM